MTSSIQGPKFEPADPPMDCLIELSRTYGANPEFVPAGGGSASIKDERRLWVNTAGRPLAGIAW